MTEECLKCSYATYDCQSSGACRKRWFLDRLDRDLKRMKGMMRMGEDSVIGTTTYGYSEGKWIRGKYTDDDLRYNDYSYRCNRCGKIVDFEEDYCPRCRAKMNREE